MSQAFQEWDVNDTTCLSRVVKELLKLYRDHQQVLVSSTNRLQFELNSLIENTPYAEVDVWSNVMEYNYCVFVLLDNRMIYIIEFC